MCDLDRFSKIQSHMWMITLKHLQNSGNMRFDTTKIKQNEPYIAVTEAGETQYLVVVERKIIIQSITFQDALIDMIGCYFALDITYPPTLYPVLLTIQRFVMGIKDKQAVPPAVTRMLAS